MRPFHANGNPVAQPMLLNVGFLALTSMRKRQLRPMDSSARTAAMSCGHFRANGNPVARPMLLNVGFLALTSMRKWRFRSMDSSA